MKIKMVKAVHADGAFRKVGDVIDVTEEKASELIRTQVAEKTAGAPKKVKK